MIDPLPNRPVTCNHECQDITLACLESILSQATFEPTDAGRASDGVEAEGPDAGAVVAVDGEAHCVSVDVASIGSPDVLGTDRVTVYPLSQAGVAREPKQFQDLHAADVGVAILSQGT